MTHSKGVIGGRSGEGPLTKVGQVQKKAEKDGEAPGPDKAGSHCHPQVQGARGRRRGARTSVRSFRSENKYLFLTVPTSSGHLPVSPIDPNQEEAKVHGNCVGIVPRGPPPGVQGRMEKDRWWIWRDRWRMSVQNLGQGDPGRLFWAVHQRSYSRCPRISAF